MSEKSTNYSELKNLVLSEILAGRTSSEVSLLLGYSFDKYRRWIDNSKIFKWDEFCEVCKAMNLDLTGALGCLPFPIGEYKEARDMIAFLKTYNSFATNQQLADYLNCHLSVVKRYMQRETIPDVESVFKLIDCRENYLATFLKILFSSGIENVKLSQWVSEKFGTVEFSAQSHIYHLIEALVSLNAYKKRATSTATWLADKIELSEKEINLHLEKMLEAGSLAKDGPDEYRKVHAYTFVQNSFQQAIPYFLGLNQRAHKRLEFMKDNPEAVEARPTVAHFVYAADQETAQKVKALLLKTYTDLVQLVDAADKTTDVDDKAYYMLLQVVPIGK